MAKTKRRTCDNPACGKQYRYSRADSKTCSPRCRTVLSRQRKAEKEAAIAAIKVFYRKLRAEAAAEREAAAAAAAPRPTPVSSPAPPPTPKRRSSLFPPPPEPTQTITIKLPTRAPMTPLDMRRLR